MHTFDPKQGWGANPGIVLLKSKDLVNWTHAKINLSKDWSKNFGGIPATAEGVSEISW